MIVQNSTTNLNRCTLLVKVRRTSVLSRPLQPRGKMFSIPVFGLFSDIINETDKIIICIINDDSKRNFSLSRKNAGVEDLAVSRPMILGLGFSYRTPSLSLFRMYLFLAVQIPRSAMFSFHLHLLIISVYFVYPFGKNFQYTFQVPFDRSCQGN